MKVPGPRATLKQFRSDQSGATMVELAIVLPSFLLLLMVLIDFGKLAYDHVMAQKAMQIAARIAVVRPAACSGVPLVNARGVTPAGSTPPYYGTACNAGGTVCAAPAVVTCVGDALNFPTAAEIWGKISPLMPSNATVANLKFTYAYTSDFGFLGGPYSPMVTVQTTGLTGQFISPLGGLLALAGKVTGLAETWTFPAYPVSLPAEDLAQGNDG